MTSFNIFGKKNSRKVFQLHICLKRTFTLGAANSQLWPTVLEQKTGFLEELSEDSGVKDPLNKIPYMKTKNQSKMPLISFS